MSWSNQRTTTLKTTNGPLSTCSTHLHIDLTFKLILHILNQQGKHRWLKCLCCTSSVVTNCSTINLHLSIKLQKQWWIDVHDLNSWMYIKKQPCYHRDPVINKPTKFLMEINKGFKRFMVNDKPNERIKLYKHPIIPMATLMQASLGIHKWSWDYLMLSKLSNLIYTLIASLWGFLLSITWSQQQSLLISFWTCATCHRFYSHSIILVSANHIHDINLFILIT